MDQQISDLDFTMNAWNTLYQAVDDTYFSEKDAEIIYTTLDQQLRFIFFGEYLKRYIYEKAQMQEPYLEVPDKIYQEIIKESFAENHTPKSFAPTTAKLSALSKNWLTQQTVKRSAVFLLGFGLRMSVNDVSDFLKKALREQGYNAKDPFEVICWYCFQNRYSYLKFEQLWQQYLQGAKEAPLSTLPVEDYTSNVRQRMLALRDEESLLRYVSELKDANWQTKQGKTARKCFDALYDEARALVADIYNREEEDRHTEEMICYQKQLLNNDRLYDYEKQDLLSRKRGERKFYKKEDITDSDMEQVICSAIPKDRHGNLTPAKKSRLNAQFAGKRFSRQRMREIVKSNVPVNRFDLITLNFFIYSQSLHKIPNAKRRYTEFINATNKILEECDFGKLYIANPYECFVLMCILSEDPLGTYADVWELSYEEAGE